MSKAILLFAHGARDPAWARPIERLAALLGEDGPEIAVGTAFLEFMTPALDVAIDERVAQGAEEILVVPVFLAQGGHVKRDLPALLDAARVRHPACRIRLAAAVGEDGDVLAAIADYVRRALAAP